MIFSLKCWWVVNQCQLFWQIQHLHKDGVKDNKLVLWKSWLSNNLKRRESCFTLWVLIVWRMQFKVGGYITSLSLCYPLVWERPLKQFPNNSAKFPLWFVYDSISCGYGKSCSQPIMVKVVAKIPTTSLFPLCSLTSGVFWQKSLDISCFKIFHHWHLKENLHLFPSLTYEWKSWKLFSLPGKVKRISVHFLDHGASAVNLLHFDASLFCYSNWHKIFVRFSAFVFTHMHPNIGANASDLQGTLTHPGMPGGLLSRFGSALVLH